MASNSPDRPGHFSVREKPGRISRVRKSYPEVELELKSLLFGSVRWLTLVSSKTGTFETLEEEEPSDFSTFLNFSQMSLYQPFTPGIPKLGLRVEGVTTDPPVSRSVSGQFMYWEDIERQGYTNQGQIFGDWIGREDKGGQAWVGYHLSGNEWVQLSVRHQKAATSLLASRPPVARRTCFAHWNCAVRWASRRLA